jgi:hypothetical protein
MNGFVQIKREANSISMARVINKVIAALHFSEK